MHRRSKTHPILVRLRPGLAALALASAAVLAFVAAMPHPGGTSAPPAPPASTVAFDANEELEYNVSFLSIHLGTVRIKTDASSTRDGRKVWHSFCYADSRQGIPFVSLHVVYESFIDELGAYSHGFVASDKQSDDSWVYTKYDFDFPQKLVTIENGSGSTMWKKFTIESPLKYCDGLALFFYARRNAMYRKTANVPTIIQNDTARTIINFLGERESQEIDAVNYPVDCNHFEGTANWTGVYGLTGKFEGWFSNDVASVPIKARLKLLVGSAWLELAKWNRAGWAPPLAH